MLTVIKSRSKMPERILTQSVHGCRQRLCVPHHPQLMLIRRGWPETLPYHGGGRVILTRGGFHMRVYPEACTYTGSQWTGAGQARRRGESSESGGARRCEAHVSASLTFAELRSRENELDRESEGLCWKKWKNDQRHWYSGEKKKKLRFA